MRARLLVLGCSMFALALTACGASGDENTDAMGPGGSGGSSAGSGGSGGSAGSSAGSGGSGGSGGSSAGSGGSNAGSGGSNAGSGGSNAGSGGSDAGNGGTDGGSGGTDAGNGGTDGGSGGSDAGAGGADAGSGGSDAGNGGSGAGTGGAGAAGGPACEPECNEESECISGVCVPKQGSCATNSDCKYDTRCVDGACVPYNPGENDPACLFVPSPEVLAPTVKCEFINTPPGDPYPTRMNVSATPMVGNLGYGAPSIVVPFQGSTNGVSCPLEDCNYRFGVIRILSGVDCKQQAIIGGKDWTNDGRIEWARGSSSVALADLDGDGVAEIIAYMVEQFNPTNGTGNEVLMAFTNYGAGWVPYWPKITATNPDGSQFNATVPVSGSAGSNWAAPTIHDLDDDGIPEIIREGYVFDSKTGVLKTGLPPGYATYNTGTAAVLANIDDDPQIEMSNGQNLWEYNPTTKQWDLDPNYATAATGVGWTAIADFNPYDGQKTAEIAVVTNGKLTIFDNKHAVFQNVSVTLPSSGGGPPTIADFDGDGLPEVGVATSDYYVVVDPDCQSDPRPGGKCESRNQCEHAVDKTCNDFILWSRKSQDHSSRITGSSVFDFEDDGKAEVIYADECFARVYSGVDGKVLFSLYHSSGTWQENPVIADVDGDFRADLIVVSNGNFTKANCAELLDANEVETHFAGEICEKNADCFSGTCDAGLCRCTSSQQCCPGEGSDDACVEAGRQCAPPPAGTPGTGNTCRASFPHGSLGLRVYKDSRDRWVGSRTWWNQHAYSVTNINDNGSIPKTSAWKQNWQTEDLNNFRQNTHGAVEKGQIPDLTAQVSKNAQCFLNEGGGATLEVPVCNRGTAPVGNNLHVGFYVGQDKICTGTIKDPIAPGECAMAYCNWQSPPQNSSDAADVRVVPNDDAEKSECDQSNNEGIVKGVVCIVKP